MFRDCMAAKEVWKLKILSDQQNRFFSDPFHIWFSTNVGCNVILQEHRITWASVFGLIVWRIWNNKNLYIFQNVTWPALEIIKVSLSRAHQFAANQEVAKVTSMSPPSKVGSEGQWTHLFTDGAVE